MSNFKGGWARCVDVGGVAGLPASPRPAGSGPTSAVVGLGAICDIGGRETYAHGRSQSFLVSEFALLGNGAQIILHEDRGFTIGSNGDSIQQFETFDTITQSVLNVVLPDEFEESKEDHPWPALAEMARHHGLQVTAEELRNLPYEVILSDRLTAWLARPQC